MATNLAVVGHRNFYDYGAFESHIENWVEKNGKIDLIICGGASGADYLAERWANNNAVSSLIFHEEWATSRPGLIDSGRNEAAYSLTVKIVQSATHLIAFLDEDSKWTKRTLELALDKGIPVTIHEV
ncbi:MAG: SLOG family protein [Candidatus Thalassarchaeaceae archaeon]|nr:SLOG family protein [Candidatus Thalassarchaeaceae archaeon]